MKWAPLLMVLIGGVTVTNANAQTVSPEATAEVRTADGQRLASATFRQAASEVLISIAFANRTALLGTHALQIHTVGQCSPPTFESAGPVFDPSGDLPDLVIGPAGVAVYNLSAPDLSIAQLLGGRGSSLLVYAAADGGEPIACGVIRGRGEPDVGTSRGTSLLIATLGGLLIAGGVILRRGA